jgi:hypothetical protein
MPLPLGDEVLPEIPTPGGRQNVLTSSATPGHKAHEYRAAGTVHDFLAHASDHAPPRSSSATATPRSPRSPPAWPGLTPNSGAGWKNYGRDPAPPVRQRRYVPLAIVIAGAGAHTATWLGILPCPLMSSTDRLRDAILLVGAGSLAALTACAGWIAP